MHKATKFGEVIKALRLSEGLTLEKAAKRAGTHKGYWSGWENGTVNPPSVKILEKLVRLFKSRLITVEDLVELAWVSKAPLVIRQRELDRIACTNSLFQIRLVKAGIAEGRLAYQAAD